MKGGDHYDSPTARTLCVLAWFAQHPGCSVAELGRATGLTKTTAHRVVGELERLGWLTSVPGRKGPVIGPSGLDMAANTMRQRMEGTASALVLQRLADEIGESCTVAVQDGTDARFIESVPPRGSVAYVFPMRDRAPLFCSSSGRIFLAEWSEAALDQYLAQSQRPALTEHTVIDADALRRIVKEVRTQGYASASQQWVANVIGAAVPVRDKRGRCIAALSFNAPDNRITPADIPRLIDPLRATAQELGRIFEAFPSM